MGKFFSFRADKDNVPVELGMYYLACRHTKNPYVRVLCVWTVNCGISMQYKPRKHTVF